MLHGEYLKDCVATRHEMELKLKVNNSNKIDLVQGSVQKSVWDCVNTILENVALLKMHGYETLFHGAPAFIRLSPN